MVTIETKVSATWFMRHLKAAMKQHRHPEYFEAALVELSGQVSNGSMTREAFGTRRIYRQGKYVKTVRISLQVRT